MRSLVIVAALLAASCSNPPAPPPPSAGDGGAPVTVTLSERLGWDQPAADAAELATIGYEIYIDGNGSPLAGVQCGDTPSAAGFECRAPLPQMTPGPHSLELASFFLNDPGTKSARAGPLNINVRPLVSGEPVQSRLAPQSARRKRADGAPAAPEWPAGTRPIAIGLDRVADLAFTPDGRLLIAERSGAIRIVRGEELLADPALTLPAGPGGEGAVVSLAVDPQFARTGFVYAIQTARMRSGALGFALARYREAGNTLADAIVVLDEIPASIDARAVLRFGLDGKLYAAFDDGGSPAAAQDPASYNGKVLRLNPDGTTPDDAALKSPILLAGLDSPRGLGWHAPTRHLWVATSTQVDALRWPSAPNALAACRDALFIGSNAGLMRATLDADVAGRIARADDVLSGMPVRALAARGDGTLFFATDDAVGTLVQ